MNVKWGNVGETLISNCYTVNENDMYLLTKNNGMLFHVFEKQKWLMPNFLLKHIVGLRASGISYNPKQNTVSLK